MRGHQHEAAAPAQLFLAPLRGVMSHDYSMEPRRRHVGQVEGERLGTSAVEKQAVGMRFNPTLGTPHLVR